MMPEVKHVSTTGFCVSKMERCRLKTQPRSGHRSTSTTDENVEKMDILVREDRRRTINQPCEHIVDFNSENFIERFAHKKLQNQLREDPDFL